MHKRLILPSKPPGFVMGGPQRSSESGRSGKCAALGPSSGKPPETPCRGPTRIPVTPDQPVFWIDLQYVSSGVSPGSAD